MGDTLAAQGRIDEAIVAYRRLVYEDNTFASVNCYSQLSPLTKLPSDVHSVAEAQKMHPDAPILNWVSNDPCVLAKYALLLVETKRYEEAIFAYNRGLNFMDDSPYRAVLALGDITPKSSTKVAL